MAKKRAREFLRPPRDGLVAIGVDPVQVGDVIISHMRYDHAGNHDLFPNATFHVQDQEMALYTGRCMCHPQLRRSFEEAGTRRHRRQARRRAARVDQPARTPAAAASRTSSSRPQSMSSSEPNAFM
jgi:glyoxylase-like metal-dependent hydrolase (beta-lactamase superfamily II)